MISKFSNFIFHTILYSNYVLKFDLVFFFFLLKMKYHISDCYVSLPEANWRRSSQLSKHYICLTELDHGMSAQK